MAKIANANYYENIDRNLIFIGQAEMIQLCRFGIKGALGGLVLKFNLNYAP